MIVRLFSEGDRLRSKYGCAVSPEPADGGASSGIATNRTLHGVDTFAASFVQFRLFSKSDQSSAKRSLGKTKWLILDRPKFEKLIQEIRGLITGLQDIADLEDLTVTELKGLIYQLREDAYQSYDDAPRVASEELVLSVFERTSPQFVGHVDTMEQEVSTEKTPSLNQQHDNTQRYNALKNQLTTKLWSPTSRVMRLSNLRLILDFIIRFYKQI